jgi:hypothetical protein
MAFTFFPTAKTTNPIWNTSTIPKYLEVLQLKPMNIYENVNDEIRNVWSLTSTP